MAAAVTIEDLESRQTEIRNRLQEIDTQFTGQALPDEQRSEWDALNEERDTNDRLIAELRARTERIEQLAANPENREDGATFQTPRPGVARDGDIFDLSTVRTSFNNPRQATVELRDRAMRAIDRASFPHDRANREDCQEHIRHLLDTKDDAAGTIARRILTTGSPEYQRAFPKVLSGQPLSPDEQRAMSLTGASGGFAVPYQLDPTIIPTSNSAVNPYRAISRIETITVDEWRGVSSAGITASYATEAAEASDNSPTLAQPTVSTERAQAFVPFSFEVGQDWGSLQSEMAQLIQDAKDDLEADKFTDGSGTNEPQGVQTGATGTVAAGTAAFAVAHLYALEEALAPRFRPRAVFVANRAQYNRVRQFDTSGGASLWVYLREGLANQVPAPGNTGAMLLGYPAYEASDMASVLTAGSRIMTLGDFRYFLIVDRIGMNIDLIPHLFGASGRPTGQKGLYAFWRNSSKVLSTAAFKTLVTT